MQDDIKISHQNVIIWLTVAQPAFAKAATMRH